jgi:uncharacterized lipoprotein YddW (UPF0748 family)
MKLLRWVTLFLLSVLALAWPQQRVQLRTTESTKAVPEFRALWVDGFHAGIRSPEEVAQLIADAKRANVNTLIVQVRRRGDALYTKSFEPPVEDPAYDGKFDGLAAILDAAHREGIEVHAWINAMPIWRDAQPPKDPRHVYNQHGPAQAGEANWLTRSPKGETKFPVGYFLDPGHPGAAAYLSEVYLNIVRNYPIDGIHFDYIRYPETEERLERGAGVGYNATSLARFRRATGRTDLPAPDDRRFTEWRRQQITQLVRRIYVEAKALNPRLKVSAASIAWGKPPKSERDFLDMSPGQRVFQDWHGWLREGILDLAIPMNYAREADPNVRGWFDGWIKWEKQHCHGRQIAVGVGAYLNSKESNLAQLARIRKPVGNGMADGMSFFSYASMYMGPRQEPSAPPQLPAADRFDYLSQGANAPFESPAPVPPMPWIDKAVTGWIAGMAIGPDGKGIDGVTVEMRRSGWSPFRRIARSVTDGNGWFGFAGVDPGRYEFRFARGAKAAVDVAAGKVSRAELRALK